MNLKKKKKLISRVLNVGVNKVILDANRIDEIKEAITRQDIKDLESQGIIRIKEARGKKKKGKVRGKKVKKKNIVDRKKHYVKLTRKLRTYLKGMKKKGKLDGKEYENARKRIKASMFDSLAHLREVMK